MNTEVKENNKDEKKWVKKNLRIFPYQIIIK